MHEPATASISTRVITGSVLYNILIARNAWAHLRLGGGSTNYAETRPVAA